MYLTFNFEGGGMRKTICAALSAAVLLIANTANAKGPFGSIKVGHWAGGAYTNDNTGAFSHCAAGAPYLNGTYVVFGQLADQSWTIGFGNT